MSERRHPSGFDSDVAERIRADDLDWFRARPQATIHLRPAVPGEAPAFALEPDDRWAQITRLESGDLLYLFFPDDPRDMGMLVDDDGMFLGIEETVLRLYRGVFAGTSHAN